ncbi:unnamed protein product [Colletotrichum noveboracense]|uniref:BTB domain-containing protein n=1 Tax=Colletotrichum noveboracense TaxID=2664923 RepID=A0A9W4WGH2_9PEZI|nr:hypothetical protein COL940_005777 [Colletotrichum noveboracense]KAJ0289152.1 hypothetical protein CBS470a_004508 [Colletotrichum nupharicola]KAJ0316651.1 hypothetical protein Brms1b_005369 [Colletotrichum noveboracense]CAI0651284.1 unnamed protein product [Colletotrichum noveboracense]
MESNANGVTEGDKPASLGMAAMDLSWLFCSAEEQLLITIKCGEDGDEKTFTVLKPILTKHSKFFEKCLRNPCKESASSTIELPEVKPGRMMLYLTLANRQALMRGSSTNKTLVELDDFSAATALESHVKFYQLCDFLQNDALAKGVRDMLVRYVKNRDRVHDEDDAPTIFRVYAGAFDLLEPGHVGQAKLRRILVKNFCRLAVPSVYFRHCSVLSNYPEFLMEVGKQYALNAMWNDPFLRSTAEGIKTQRMLIDDESETQQ